jgi:D-aminopeptidase
VFAIALADEILDACLPGLGPVEVVQPREPATGLFRSPATGRVVQLFGREGQQIVSIDGVDMPAHPDSEGVLWLEGRWFGYTRRGTSVTLVGERARPSELRLSEFGNPDRLERLQAPDKADLRAIVGRYCSAASGTTATILETPDGPRFVTAGRFGSATYHLECLADGLWRSRQATAMLWGGILSFNEPNRGFRFSGYTTRSLPFRREH